MSDTFRDQDPAEWEQEEETEIAEPEEKPEEKPDIPAPPEKESFFSRLKKLFA